MAANTNPIFPLTPVVGFGKLTTANNVYDGTGTQVTLLTAGTNGTRLDSIKIKHLGTNAATVLRVFLNNGNDNTVATNNSLLLEVSINSANASASAALTEIYDLDVNKSIPAGYRVMVSIGTTISAGISVNLFGGDY